MCIIDVAPSSYFSCTIATLAPSFHTIYYVPKDKFSSSSSLSSKSLQQPIHKGSHQQFEDWYIHSWSFLMPKNGPDYFLFFNTVMGCGRIRSRVLFNLGWGCTPGPTIKTKSLDGYLMESEWIWTGTAFKNPSKSLISQTLQADSR